MANFDRYESLVVRTEITQEMVDDPMFLSAFMETAREGAKDEAIYRCRDRFHLEPEREIQATIYQEFMTDITDIEDEVLVEGGPTKRFSCYVRVEWNEGVEHLLRNTPSTPIVIG